MASTKPNLCDDYCITEEEKTLEDYTELAAPRKSQWQRVMRSQAITISLQIIGALAAVGAGTARPLMTIIWGTLIDEYNKNTATKFSHRINRNVLLLLFIFIAQWTCVCTYGVLFSIAAMRYSMRMRALYLKAVVSQDVEQVSESSAANDLSINAGVIEEAMAEKLGTIVQAISTVATSVVISFYYNWRLALGLLFVVVVLLLKDAFVTRIETRLERQVQEVEKEASTMAEECISGIRTVTAYRAASKFAQRYDEIAHRVKLIALRTTPITASHYSVVYLVILCAYALAFWYGTELLQRGQIKSGGTICIVLMSLNTGLNGLRLLLPLYSVVAKAMAAHAALSSVINTPSTLDPFSEAGMPLDALYSRIEFQNVDFAYPKRPTVKVLKNFNVTFGAGKLTAVIGPSGCGKSSIVALLERFYNASSGYIQVNGSNLEEYNVKSLRSSIRAVQQDAALFNDSIFNNISHGLIGSPYHALSDKEKRRLVTNVCKQIQIHDFISQLPNRYDSIVGTRGCLLSGGQRQRVAIARAIISNPVILIFDEATSALDAESERLVQAAIDRVSRGRTTIMIAHNLATIKRADRIVLMKEGAVVEEGTHESLLRSSETYVRSWMAQNVTTEEHWTTPTRQLSNGTSASDSNTSIINRTKHDSEQLGRDEYVHKDNIDMMQDQPMSFLCSARFAFSAGRVSQILWVAVLSVAVIGGAVFPAQSVIFGHEVVSFQKQGADLVKSIRFWSLMFFMLAIVASAAFFTHAFLSSMNGIISANLNRRKYFRGLLAQPIAFFEKTSNMPGTLVASLSSHPAQLQAFVMILGSLAVTVVNLSSVSILGLIISWKYGLVCMVSVVPVISTAGFLRIKAQSMKSKNLTEPLLESAQYASEVIGNIRTVSAFAMEAEVCSMMASKMNKSLVAFYKNVSITMPLFAFSHAGNLLGMTFSFWYAGKLLTEQKIDALEVWIIFLGMITGAEATSEFFASTSNIVYARSSCGHISRVTSTLSNEDNIAEHHNPEKPQADSITFDQVSFSYPNMCDTPILHDISFHVKPGEYVAIVGPSGSGKSTMISLLEQFYQPTSGRLLVGDKDVSDVDIDTYRNHVSLVSQDTQLFDGTVRDNILLGVTEGDVSEERMIQAARDAHIDSFIASLPEGYNTSTGRKGTAFSGGQRQRLAIARALVRNPSILILDEATSALDSESEREVKKALNDASVGRTTIAVAHRLSTIRDADCIYVLVKGRIVESGTHEQLTTARGVYWGMCQRRGVEY